MPPVPPRSLARSGRYSVPRRYINWYKTDELMCLKMLTHVLHEHEAECRNRIKLWHRVSELTPKILQSVLGVPKTFEQVRKETLIDQLIPINPNRLYQRSDKTGRYQEFNIHLDCVTTAYRALTGIHEDLDVQAPMPRVQAPMRRTFTDDEVRAALYRQGGRCFYRGCCCDDGVVGDHIIPFSQGGPTESFNCAAACVRCNTEKGKMSVFEYGKLIGAQQSRGRKL